MRRSWTFTNRFNTAYNAISKKEITIPPSTRSFILVQKAAITEELKRLIIHKIDFSKAQFFDEVSKSLIWIMGDSKKVTNEFWGEIFIAEKVEERLTEVMAGWVEDGEENQVKGRLEEELVMEKQQVIRQRCQ